MVISIAMIAGHNLLDGINVSSWGSFAWLIEIIHVPGTFTLFNKVDVHILYPLIPWIGVMALGYAMGPLFLKEQGERRGGEAVKARHCGDLGVYRYTRY